MTIKVTSEYLAELRRLADAATPGPWEFRWSDNNTNPIKSVIKATYDWNGQYPIVDIGEIDGKFIATSRTAIPALLDHIEKLGFLICEWVDGSIPEKEGYYFVETNRGFHGDIFNQGSWQCLKSGENVLRYFLIPPPPEVR